MITHSQHGPFAFTPCCTSLSMTLCKRSIGRTESPMGPMSPLMIAVETALMDTSCNVATAPAPCSELELLRRLNEDAGDSVAMLLP